MKSSQKSSIGAVIFLFALIIITRLATIPAHLYVYPDEVVFNVSAYRLSRFLIGSIDSYVPYKPYPEGGFTLQVPLQLMGAVVGRLLHTQVPDRILGRATSVCFFIAGAAIGVSILRRRFPEKKTGVSVFYLLIMLFGLMHIEQSRYGIGNAPSYFFLMLLVFLTDYALCPCRHPRLTAFLAYMSAGALASLKYPQVYFVIIPFWAFCAGKGWKSKSVLKEITFALAGILLGFSLLSPKSLVEPIFIYKAIVSETNAYVINPAAVRDVWGHITEWLLYEHFYAGMPLLPFVILLPLIQKSGSRTSPEVLLYQRIIPIAVCIFVFYNLFAKLFALRNLYPAMVLCDLYAAAAAAKLFSGSRRSRAAVVALTAVMCLRGAYYDYALCTDDPYGHFDRIMSETDSDPYEDLTVLTPGWLGFDREAFSDLYTYIDLTDDRFAAEEGFALQKGEFFVSACQEYYYCSHYPFERKTPQRIELCRRWERFKEVNAAYKIEEYYPRHYYYVFGYWIPGTTGAGVEFPMHIFYRNPKNSG